MNPRRLEQIRSKIEALEAMPAVPAIVLPLTQCDATPTSGFPISVQFVAPWRRGDAVPTGRAAREGAAVVRSQATARNMIWRRKR